MFSPVGIKFFFRFLVTFQQNLQKLGTNGFFGEWGGGAWVQSAATFSGPRGLCESSSIIWLEGSLFFHVPFSWCDQISNLSPSFWTLLITVSPSQLNHNQENVAFRKKNTKLKGLKQIKASWKEGGENMDEWADEQNFKEKWNWGVVRSFLVSFKKKSEELSLKIRSVFRNTEPAV